MLGYRNDIPRAGFGEEIEPRIGVEVLRAEHGDEILIAEFGLRPVGCNVVFERSIARDVHVARIPFVSECRNGINAPVDENAELGIAKPLGYAIAGKRIPIGAERTGARSRVDPRQLPLHICGRLLRVRRAGQRDQHGCGEGKLDSAAALFAFHPIQASRCGASLRIALMHPGAVSRADGVLHDISEAHSGLRAWFHLRRGPFVIRGCAGACRSQFWIASVAADRSALR